MNAPNETRPVAQKTRKKLFLIPAGLLYLILLVVAASIFYESDCLMFGPEQIVGAPKVGYHDDGSFYYTNPVAMLFRYFLYLLLLAVLTWFAAAGCESRFHLFRRSAYRHRHGPCGGRMGDGTGRHGVASLARSAFAG